MPEIRISGLRQWIKPSTSELDPRSAHHPLNRTSGDEVMGKEDKKKKQTMSKADKEEFKRFAKNARKVGLLVNRKACNLYFRERFSPKTETAE